MGKKSKNSGIRRPQAGTLKNAVYLMEPDLHLFEGVVALLRILSESSEPIDPIAIEPVAQIAGEATERLLSQWRASTEMLQS